MLHCSLWPRHTTGTTFWINLFLGIHENFTAGFILKMGANPTKVTATFLRATQLFWKVESYIRSASDGNVISA